MPGLGNPFKSVGKGVKKVGRGIRGLFEGPDTEAAVETQAEATADVTARWEDLMQKSQDFISGRTAEGLETSSEQLMEFLKSDEGLRGEALDFLGSAARDTAGALRETLDPGLKTGQKALSQWERAMGLSGDFDAQSFLESLPGYQARMAAGQKAALSAASVRGGMGGRALKELTRFGQGLGAEYWGDYMTDLGKGMDLWSTTAGQMSTGLTNLGMGVMSAGTDIYGTSMKGQAGAYGTHLANIGSLYGTGMGVGTQALTAGTSGITQSLQALADAEAAGHLEQGFGRTFLENVNVNWNI